MSGKPSLLANHGSNLSSLQSRIQTNCHPEFISGSQIKKTAFGWSFFVHTIIPPAFKGGRGGVLLIKSKNYIRTLPPLTPPNGGRIQMNLTGAILQMASFSSFLRQTRKRLQVASSTSNLQN